MKRYGGIHLQKTIHPEELEADSILPYDDVMTQEEHERRREMQGSWDYEELYNQERDRANHLWLENKRLMGEIEKLKNMEDKNEK